MPVILITKPQTFAEREAQRQAERENIEQMRRIWAEEDRRQAIADRLYDRELRASIARRFNLGGYQIGGG